MRERGRRSADLRVGEGTRPCLRLVWRSGRSIPDIRRRRWCAPVISLRWRPGWILFGCLTISSRCRRVQSPHRSTWALHGLFPKIDALLEPWTVLGHLAARNRLGRLRLGIGVTDAGRRNPAVTAQAAATLHLLTRGRAILGIGTGERESNQPYGVDWSTPVARFEEAMATIRALWDSGGELVTRDSPYFPLRNAVFDLPPYRGRWPEIWIAAHGPRMLRVTGRYADAWFPAFAFRPTDYAAGLEAVRAAASDAGRDAMSIIPASFRFVATGRSRDEVDEALSSPFAKSFALNMPAEEWTRHGVRHPLGDEFTGLQDLTPQMLDEQTVLSYTSDVPLSLLKEGAFTGTPLRSSIRLRSGATTACVTW